MVGVVQLHDYLALYRFSPGAGWGDIDKDRRYFIIWSGTNAFWAVYDGAKGQSLLFLVYFILAVWEQVQWPRDKHP